MGQKMRFTGLLLRDGLVGAAAGVILGRVIASAMSSDVEVWAWLGGVVGVVGYVGYRLQAAVKYARGKQADLAVEDDLSVQAVEAGERSVALTWREAESWVTNEIRVRFDEPDALVTRASQDGGIDVESARMAAQVKHYAKPVGASAVRELYGVAVAKGKVPVFFAQNGFTAAALEFASSAASPGVLLFSYDAQARRVAAVNRHAREAVERRSFVAVNRQL